MKRLMIIATAIVVAGCSAEFTDLRPEESDAGGSANNIGATDTGMETQDAGSNANTSDATAATDSSAEPDAAGGEATLLASGDFVNVDYDTTGSAEYWQLADGSYEVRLSDDFSVSGVPGPAIALSPRNPLGGSIDNDELNLGGLDSNSGGQAYGLPGAPDAYAYVWIWCEPFGLDVAYAQMEFQ